MVIALEHCPVYSPEQAKGNRRRFERNLVLRDLDVHLLQIDTFLQRHAEQSSCFTDEMWSIMHLIVRSLRDAHVGALSPPAVGNRGGSRCAPSRKSWQPLSGLFRRYHFTQPLFACRRERDTK